MDSIQGIGSDWVFNPTDDFGAYSSKEEIRSRKAAPVNGKIDAAFSQGTIGDCALLATLYALAQTPEGEEAISDSISVEKGLFGRVKGYKVKFPGIDEEYYISKRELNAAKNGINNRRYSYGDDDMTLIELAIEDCSEESLNEEIRYLVDNYPGQDCTNDKLHGVNPAMVTYAFLGEKAETFNVRPDETLSSRFIPNEDYVVQDLEGNDVPLQKNEIYKALEASTEYIKIHDPRKQQDININFNSFMQNALTVDADKDRQDAKLKFENFSKNPNSEVLIYSGAMKTGEYLDVKDPNGNPIQILNCHAFAVVAVNGDTVSLVNPHNSDETVEVSLQSLLEIPTFTVFSHQM